jgi:hypothetical protein
MLCARVMRGISSSAKNETPVSASLTISAATKERQILAAEFGVRAERPDLRQDFRLFENFGP